MGGVRVGCTFDELVLAAAGHEPYHYQRRLAVDGLPELLNVPTGAGKTLAATLPWLYRRRFHPDGAVRAPTPRRLVIVLPQRALVEQTERVVRGWCESVSVNIGVHVLLGGVSRDDRAWKLRPEADAIFVGTQDMVLSRLLLRGYAEAPGARPMSFGLLNSGTQFVFDEVQLMGPGLPTSLQLEALRRSLGTAESCRSMWMSATVDLGTLATVDYVGPSTTVEISEADRTGPLADRLAATRLVTRLDVSNDAKRYPRELAAEVIARHKPGARTLVVLNTVERAQAVYQSLAALSGETRTLLLHSRFRPPDRQARTAELADVEDGIVVATQVLEAGLDITSMLLVTELAPWSSIIQRAGRCNRDGNAHGAVLAWVAPPGGRASAAPYVKGDLAASEAALRDLEGSSVTSGDLISRDVAQERSVYPVLRRRDVLGLFDTTPDLAGNDLDVGRWIRDADETTVYAAWRNGEPDTTAEQSAGIPSRDELCPVPVGGLRAWVRKKKAVWRYDHMTAEWVRVLAERDVRPGAVYLLVAAEGGYLPELGWSPRERRPVPVIAGDAVVDAVDAVGDDTASARSGRAVTLAQHLDDVDREVHALIDQLGPLLGLDAHHVEAAALAGRFHDLGKAHPVFQESLRNAADGALGDGIWAKSDTHQRLRHRRRYFRHELVSALMLLDGASHLLNGVDDPDLVAYLVAAHHGKVRMAVRSMPGESEDGTVLGVGHPDDAATLPLQLITGESVPAVQPDLDAIRIGSDGEPTWTARTAALRDRPDLGPFRLGFLEAIVRVADQRVSRRYQEGTGA
ncbi:type I-G CRISPR-associated helicase/endonuclease Cas3g [Phytoactinopolyspora limicola]|uniref:type I-G CRISPR-associated helicase/endonuclease Cas3g n=1 Tax=Phytoactinopolyspora limicola TaxID=2715536 RepID=UPI00140D95A0|nr:CRISPR-associated helicase Cas3' [Phytoactinopolyspora limicola]